MIVETAALRMRETGSFHVGDEMVRLEGFPVRGRVSTPGGPVHPIDPKRRQQSRAHVGGQQRSHRQPRARLAPGARLPEIIAIWATLRSIPN
jgi:hypothetical protein